MLYDVTKQHTTLCNGVHIHTLELYINVLEVIKGLVVTRPNYKDHVLNIHRSLRQSKVPRFIQELDINRDTNNAVEAWNMYKTRCSELLMTIRDFFPVQDLVVYAAPVIYEYAYVTLIGDEHELLEHNTLVQVFEGDQHTPFSASVSGCIEALSFGDPEKSHAFEFDWSTNKWLQVVGKNTCLDIDAIEIEEVEDADVLASEEKTLS